MKMPMNMKLEFHLNMTYKHLFHENTCRPFPALEKVILDNVMQRSENYNTMSIFSLQCTIWIYLVIYFSSSLLAFMSI